MTDRNPDGFDSTPGAEQRTHPLPAIHQCTALSAFDARIFRLANETAFRTSDADQTGRETEMTRQPQPSWMRDALPVNECEINLSAKLFTGLKKDGQFSER